MELTKEEIDTLLSWFEYYCEFADYTNDDELLAKRLEIEKNKEDEIFKCGLAQWDKVI